MIMLYIKDIYQFIFNGNVNNCNYSKTVGTGFICVFYHLQQTNLMSLMSSGYRFNRFQTLFKIVKKQYEIFLQASRTYLKATYNFYSLFILYSHILCLLKLHFWILLKHISSFLFYYLANENFEYKYQEVRNYLIESDITI